MDAIKRERKAIRTAFTKANTNFITKVTAKSSKEEIKLAFQLLEDKMTALDNIHSKYNEIMFSTGSFKDEDIDKEIECNDSYKSLYITAKLKMAEESPVKESEENNNYNSVTNTTKSSIVMKYPALELMKFSGSVKEWLSFWGTFKKVHNDNKVSKDNKLYLLRNSMVEDSRAYELVFSYPPVGDNYDKVISSLKNQFGRDDLLIEFYVRELLSLVLKNAVKGSEKMSLIKIYDKVDSYIRALDSLGVTTEKCASMLFPLVQSSLPEDVLRAWQRNGQCVIEKQGTTADNTRKDDRLTNLMEFLRLEFES